MVPSWLGKLVRKIFVNGSARRKSTRRPRTARPWLELLEDRLTPASYTWNGTTGMLSISLGTSESVTIINSAGTRSFALSPGSATFTQVGGDTATGSGGPTLSFTVANNIGTGVTINNAGAAAGTNNVTFSGIGSTDLLTSAAIIVDIGAAAAPSGTIAFSGGFDVSATATISLTTIRNITLGSGSMISTSGGGSITLSANQQATATSGDFTGIDINGGTISTSGTGNILLKGRGGNASNDFGVLVQEVGRVESTATGATAGTITLDGTGGSGSSDSYGVYITATGTLVTSVTGDILVKGKGGDGSGGNRGIVLNINAQVTSTGTAKVTLDGTGGNGGGFSYGVYMSEANSRVTSVDGDILIKGKGGDGLGSDNYGILQGNGMRVTSMGAATVTLDGTGGIGSSGNSGLRVESFNTLVTSVTGDILLKGIGGGDAASFLDYGVFVNLDARVTSTGTARVVLDGTGGGGSGGRNNGVVIASASVTSVDGNIAVTGQGGGGSPANFANSTYGVQLFGSVTSTGAANASLTTDSIDIISFFGSVNVGSNTVTDKPKTGGTAINLGGADAVGTLGLTDAELAAITAGTLIIGDTGSGTMTVSDNITRPAATDLRLFSGGDIVLGGQVNTAGGPLLLDPGTAPAALKPTAIGIDATASTVSLATPLALSIAINGTNLDSQYTRLKLTSTVDLTGVTLALTGAYVPAIGDVFTIVSATSRTGQFSGLAENAEVTFNGKQLRVNYTSTTVTLTALGDAPPDAVDDTRTVAEDSGANTLDVLSNDIPSSGLTITAVTQGLHGTDAIVSGGGAVSYTPDADFFSSDSFTYTISDGHGDTDTAAVLVTVTPVNDRPVNSVHGPQQTAMNATLNFGASLSFADVDPPGTEGSGWSVTLRVTHGRLTVINTAGVTVTGNNTDLVTVRGNSVAAVNAALRGLRFKPRFDFAGSAVLTMLTDDQGNTGEAGPLTDLSEVTFKVGNRSRGRHY